MQKEQVVLLSTVLCLLLEMQTGYDTPVYRQMVQQRLLSSIICDTAGYRKELNGLLMKFNNRSISVQELRESVEAIIVR